MIEKIGKKEYRLISTPAENVLSIIEIKKKFISKPLSVAEIGIGIGATSLEIVKRLNEKDKYFFFSYDSDVNELEKDLKNLDYCTCKLYPMGNTKCTYDSYSWNLAKLLCNGEEELFDVAYLDGAHSFFHDGLSCVLLKKLIKKGGVIVFDDIHWSFDNSPTLNPQKNPITSTLYNEEQLRSEQVLMVVNVFMEKDNEWERIGDIGNQAIYRRKT